MEENQNNQVVTVNAQPTPTQTVTGTTVPTTAQTGTSINWKRVITAIIILAAAIYGISLLFNNHSEEIKVAEKYAKSDVYDSVGEIPEVKSEVLLTDSKSAAIIVRFKTESYPDGGSYVLYITAGSVWDQTKIKDYDYNYNTKKDDIKVLFKMD